MIVLSWLAIPTIRERLAVMSKIFVLSLPRTGTTSTCIYLLEHGYKVAHTAFSEAAFELADVVADTPVFTDYASLYSQYPNSKFIYLKRPLGDWLESIRRLLLSMRKRWVADSNFFEDDIKRCFLQVFPDFNIKKEFSNEYLLACYRKHQLAVDMFFEDKPEQLLSVDITQLGAGEKILTFCGKAIGYSLNELPHVNKGRRITYWETIEHPNKVFSK